MHQVSQLPYSLRDRCENPGTSRCLGCQSQKGHPGVCPSFEDGETEAKGEGDIPKVTQQDGSRGILGTSPCSPCSVVHSVTDAQNQGC